MSGNDRDPRPFKCTHAGCEWTFSRQEHMTRHLRTHSGERPFQCKYPNCPSKFARNDELRRHIRLIHEYDTEETRNGGGLADSDKVVYNGHSRRQSEQLPVWRIQSVAQPTDRSRETSATSRESSGTPVPPRPVTSMNYYESARQTPPPSGSSGRRPVAQPSPLRGEGPSFMSPPPVTPMHPRLPLHYRPPTTGRSYTPVHLPPLQNDGYATDSGRRERHVQLPGFSEIAGQYPPGPDPNRYPRYR